MRPLEIRQICLWVANPDIILTDMALAAFLVMGHMFVV